MSGHLNPVEKTAVHAITCKTSSLQLKPDGSPSLPAQIGKGQTPLLNRFYYYRSVLVRTVLHRVIRDIQARNQSGTIQLLVLGAGFESYSEYADNNVSVYLVDQNGVIASRLLAGENNRNTHFIAADLREPEVLMQTLRAGGLLHDAPSIILVESVLAYIAKNHVNDLLQYLSKCLRQAIILIYDVTLPRGHIGFSRSTRQCFARSKAPLLSAFSSPLDISINMRKCGWKHVTSWTVQQALLLFLSPDERNISISIEPFDEFASLSMLCRQYCISIASNNCYSYDEALSWTCVEDSVAAVAKIDSATYTCSIESPILAQASRCPDQENRLKALEKRLEVTLVRVISLEILQAERSRDLQQTVVVVANKLGGTRATTRQRTRWRENNLCGDHYYPVEQILNRYYPGCGSTVSKSTKESRIRPYETDLRE